MLSKTEEYALRAAIHMARHATGEPIPAGRLASLTGIPANYLSKVLHQLTRHGVIESVRGRHGGFRLSRSPRQVTLARLLEPFGPTAGRARCLLGREECSVDAPCAVHACWEEAQDAIVEFFSRTTLATVLEAEDTACPPV